MPPKKTKQALAVRVQKLENNTNTSNARTNKGPRSRGPKGTFTVTHKEYVADIMGSDPIYSFGVNPMSPLFPWLGQLARCYDLYRVDALRIVYTPVCSSDNAGSIGMAFDYDPADAAPTSKQQLTGYDGAVRSAIHEKAVCTFKPDNQFRYTASDNGTSTGAGPSGTDIRTSTPAKFYFGPFNAPAILCGELTIEYTITFKRPEINPGGTIGAHWRKSAGVNSLLYPVNFSDTFDVVENINLTPITTSVNSITLPAGRFLVELEGMMNASTAISGAIFAVTLGAVALTNSFGVFNTLSTTIAEPLLASYVVDSDGKTPLTFTWASGISGAISTWTIRNLRIVLYPRSMT